MTMRPNAATEPRTPAAGANAEAPRFSSSSRDRRGTIIVLALAVLAVLALAGVSYVSFTQLERDSARAASETADFSQQIDVANEWIGAVLTADLFGNKLVDASVPNSTRGGRPIWPRMFEDGEAYDAPNIASTWFENSESPTNDNRLVLDPEQSTLFRTAPEDDAWLASTEPDWDFNNIQLTDTWHQLTNLRSVYIWKPVNFDGTVGTWERQDGAFIDLAALVQDPLPGNRPNAGVDLIEDGIDRDLGPQAGFQQEVWNLTMPRLSQELYGLPLSGATQARTLVDEREFMDTDGDNRPDARWTQLDTLNNGSGGFLWVIAANIRDASALVNINSAIEFPYEISPGDQIKVGVQNPYVIGTGETPADIDLFRILTGDYRNRLGVSDYDQLSNDASNAFQYQVNLNPLTGFGIAANNTPYKTHLEQGLGLDIIIPDLQDPRDGYFDRQLVDPNIPGTQRELRNAYDTAQLDETWYVTSGDVNALTRAQRKAFWENVGSARPRESSGAFDRGYAVRELLDLRAFYGSNNGQALSRFAQYIDGPANQGLLPTVPARGRGAAVGPLRSGADPAVERGAGGSLGLPSPEAIFLDTSRHLTTVSGVGAFSPVPLTNDGFGVTGGSFQEKVRFRELAAPPRTSEAFNRLGQRVFDSIIYSLAPLAVDQPPRPGLTDESDRPGFLAITNLGRGNKASDFFYGGGDRGYAEPWLANLIAENPAPAGDPGNDIRPNSNADDARASYAFLRALSLTANLFDANDSDSEPTVFRYYPDPNPQGAGVNFSTRPEGELSSRLSFGDIYRGDDPDENAILKEIEGLDPFNGYEFSAQGGVSAIGLEKYPVLREVTTWALYQGDTPIGGQLVDDGDPPVTIDPGDIDNQVGSLIAFEFANPWNEPVNLFGYSVRFQAAQREYFQIAMPTESIAPGEVVLVYWHSGIEDDYFVGDPASGSEGFPLTFRSFVQEWRDRANASGTGRVVEGPTGLELDTVTGVSGLLDGFANDFESTPQPQDVFDRERVFFQDMVSRPVSILLIRDSAAVGPILVDRLTDDNNRPARAGSGDGFPGLADAVVLGPRKFAGDDSSGTEDPATLLGNFRILAFGRFARPSQLNAQGFPRYMIERPEDNISETLPVGREFTAAPISRDRDEADQYTTSALWAQAWDYDYPLADGAGLDAQQAGNVREGPAIDQTVAFADQLFGTAFDTVLEDDKGTQPNANETPVYQLYVPDRPLDSLADMLMVSTFATLYFHGDNPRSPMRPFDRYNLDRAFIEEAAGPGAWWPLSEQLAAEELRWSNPDQNTGVGSSPNKYFGVLNPIRYGFNRNSGAPGFGYLSALSTLDTGSGWELLTPPAIRLLDAFEPLNADDGFFAAGKVNINTATHRVIEALPMVEPLFSINGPGSPGPTGAILPFETERGDIIRAYRDREPVVTPLGTLDFGSENNPLGVSRQLFNSEIDFRLPPTRQAGGQFEPDRRRRGFTNVGELALLAEWANIGEEDTIVTASALNQGPLMVRPALDNIDAGVPPLETWSDTNPPVDRELGSWVAYSGEVEPPVDDYEERLAVFRGLSNVISVRSDVYIATYVLRAFDPDRIESIDLSQYGDPELALEDPEFQPVFESRRMIVFDRSNVRRPTDRPRILLNVELPSD